MRNFEMKKYTLLQLILVIFTLSIADCSMAAIGPDMDEVVITKHTMAVDTIPLKDRWNNFVTNNNWNPFDLKDPSEVQKEVTYDPVTGLYKITEKIGDQFYRAPTYMTFKEYMDWRAKEAERDYFKQLAGVDSGTRSKSGIIDPLAKIDLKKKLIDRLFGGNQITIKPQGNVDLTLGADYQRVQNNQLPINAQTNFGPNFQMNIKTDIQGKIGDKMDLGFNFDNQSSFKFDNKVKIQYDSEKWTEDDILKKIEGGNVSFPLKSQLIQGNQSLFGLKTELVFGHLKITAVAAEQRSQRDELEIKSGGTLQEFEIYPDDYDENRHFFLSHFNRNTYEKNLQDLPYINTPFRIINLQVWVTNDREETEQLRDIAALTDLGVGEEEYLTNNSLNTNSSNATFKDYTGVHVLNDNSRNELQDLLESDPTSRELLNTATSLKSKYNLIQSKDFEVLKARKLRTNEYSFNDKLGFLSLNVRLRPNQVLAVSYQYTYTTNGDKIYQVGEMADDVTTQNASQVIFTKLLKSSVQSVQDPNWDLMMKNVYPVGASQVDPKSFLFDIFFEDYSNGSLKRFIPIEEQLPQYPLLKVFNLDRLNTQNDPQPDGRFDFVPGVTIIPRTGAIIFPVLEPFGSSLKDIITDPDLAVQNAERIADSLAYQELYDSTIVIARQNLSKNRFVMKGEYKSSQSSEILLGAFNIPPGSVTVRAGSKVLVPNVDYEIDYGIGRIKILNEAYLQQGIPIRASFENNSLFTPQVRYLLGTRAEYKVNDHMNVGATYLHLMEAQNYSNKVNVGEDPINNRIFGFDMNYNNEIPWMTRLLDKLPFYSTSAPSAISADLEFAALKPGHAKYIENKSEDGGIVMVDDFEGSASGIPLGNYNFNEWVIASTPSEFTESGFTNDVRYGTNRGLINWYVLESQFNNAKDGDSSYSRIVDRTELFPNVTPIPGQNNILRTFDVSYYPSLRGPYNFDPPAGTSVSAGSYWDNDLNTMRLNEPETRWGGIMRYLQNNDFQRLNVEYIEFWMMNPFIGDDNHKQEDGESGAIHLNLGNVSEDILKDNLQFYENGLTSDPDNPLPTQESKWGNVPLIQPKSVNFNLLGDDARIQDLGLDGLSDAEENERHKEYIQAVLAQYPNAKVKLDPANDNFVDFNNDSLYNVQDQSVLERLKFFNNSQGNAPKRNPKTFQRGRNSPDVEDLNKNRSLDQGENYYDYKIELVNKNGEIDTTKTPFVREVVDIGDNKDERWYRFRIPIDSKLKKVVGNIQGFRSIQFMRMYMKGFKNSKTFRMANFELVRNQWRRLKTLCGSDGVNPAEFSIDAVSIEENAQKRPFNYVLPPGIQRQRFNSAAQGVLQNEKSLALQFCDLGPTNRVEGAQRDCDLTIYKLTRLDARLYKNLQVFFHGESTTHDLEDGDLRVFIRVGRDFTENYYEYEIPLVMSDETKGINDQENIWPALNKLNVDLSLLPALKLERNKLGLPTNKVYRKKDPNNANNELSIVGNPSLVMKGIQIGVRNYTDQSVCGEVWVNELRLVGMEEKGGFASIGQTEITLADLGTFSASGSYRSIGFGSLNQKLAERSLDEVIEYGAATTIDATKLLPGKLPINLPILAQYSNTTKRPKYDPYDQDILLNDNIKARPDERQELLERAQDKTEISTINVTNVRLNKKSKGKARPWDPSNVSASYSFTRTDHSDPIISKERTDNHQGSLDYVFNRQVKYWQPLKKTKLKTLNRLLSFNFYPNRFSVKNELTRYKNRRTYRLPEEFDYTFFDQRFDWARRYNLQWDFTRGLNFSFSANNQSIIDELRVVDVAGFQRVKNERGEIVGRVDDVSQKQRDDYLYNNLKKAGRTRDYDHNFSLQYTLPTRSIPFLKWTSIRASYAGDYIWDGASLNVDSLGHVISNSQQRQLTATLNFDQLYRKSTYLKKIENGNKKSRKRRSSSRTRSRQKDSKSKDKKKKKERKVSMVERILVRPLLSLRTAKLSYKENLSTVVPGVMNRPQYLGLDDKFNAPGWAFVSGLQPDIRATNNNNWLYQGANQGWFTTSKFLSQQVLQNKTQNMSMKFDFEVFKDFDINVDFRKNYMENHSEEFKKLDGNYQQMILRDLGSIEVTFMSLGTFWNRDYTGLFKQFEKNRAVISKRLEEHAIADAQAKGLTYVPGNHEIDEDYRKGFGRQNTDVAIPAFLATYTGKSPATVPLFLKDQIKALSYVPAPNWTLNYNGLSKLKWFKDIFSSFSLKHGYKSMLKISSFNSDASFNALNPYAEVQSISKNYYTRFDVPQMVISEAFSPLIGINIRTKSDFNFNTEYKKARNLAMDFYAKEMVESNTEEFVIGGGYTFRDVNIPFLTGKKGKRKRSKKKKKSGNKNSGGLSSLGKVTNTRGNNLVLNFDFAYRDDIVYNHNWDVDIAASPTRGIRSWRANPSVEYDVNDNVALRLFFDYSRSIPAVSNSYPITNMQGGITARLKLGEF